ncbi:MAG: hypothetical protein AABX08_01905 [Nanoarchaeota archaeon]
MNKRGFVSEEAIFRIFELVMVVFIFLVLFYNVKAEVKNKALDQSGEAIDLALEGALISSAPGKLEVSYPRDSEFQYRIDGLDVLVGYGASEKAYRTLLSKEVRIKQTGDKVTIEKNE